MTYARAGLILAAFLILPVATCAWGSPRVYPPNCTVPTAVRGVDAQSGVPDRADGQFTIVIRDFVNNVSPGASVVLDFSGVPDVVLCSNQLDPEATTDCASRTVRKLTDSQGRATFTVLASSTGANDAPSLGNPATIYANGVMVSTFAVSTFDLDGAGGVGANDLAVWLLDFGSGQPHARSDFDGSGDVSANDLSQWLAVFAAGASTESCRSACP